MSECKVIAIANEKGGVAKTTTTLNLGANLVRKGKKVLMIDLDPQANLTILSGYRRPDKLDKTITTIMKKVIGGVTFENSEGILENKEGLKVMPANMELKSMETNLLSAFNKEAVLSRYIKQVKKDYDYILIDCMPSVGLLVINALASADSVIIPVQPHFLPLNGMTEVLRTIDKIKAFINPRLKVEGVLITLANMHTKLAKATVDTIRQNYGRSIKVYKSIIPVGIKAAESGIAGKSVFSYKKNSKVAMDYEEFSEEVLRDNARTRNTRNAQCR